MNNVKLTNAARIVIEVDNLLFQKAIYLDCFPTETLVLAGLC